MRLGDRLATDGGFLFRWRSFLPLMLIPLFLIAMRESSVIVERIGDEGEHILYGIGLSISLLGLAIRWFTVGFVPARTSGRNTREQRADQLNTTGVYSLVRNPLYLGNYFALIGLAVVTGVWWLVLAVSLIYWLYIERVIAAEESYLSEKFGGRYEAWCATTPAFMPSFRHWERSHEAFSVRTVLKREYNGVLAVLTALLAYDALVDLVVRRETLSQWLAEDWFWLLLFAAGACLFIVLWTLKKTTRVLHVKGR